MLKNKSGFAVLEIILVIVVIAVIGFVAVSFTRNKKDQVSQNDGSGKKTEATATSTVTWTQGDGGWKAQGTPPACPSPLAMPSPADISLATAVLYPGQYRGKDYKPHGGLRFDGSPNDKISVKLPMDAKLYKGSRYIEQGETQYLLVFINPCGLMFKFDHLYTLSATYQKIVDANFPPAKENDSRTTDLKTDVQAKAGDVIATSIGFKKTTNVGFDFGVYDLRHKNDISKNSQWAAKHADDNEYGPYGICWLDLLSGGDAAKVKTLPAGDGVSGAISDYCKTSAGNTLTNTAGNP